MSDDPPPTYAFDTTPARTKGIRCHCRKCALSVFVIDSHRPPVCPFCRGSMTQSSFAPPPRKPIEILADAKSKLRRLYRRPSRFKVMVIGLTGILLLSVAVYFQLTNFEHYWYAPMVNFYSLIVGVFIISRFIFAAFYTPPPDVGHEPSVTVIIPCMNEEKVIARSIAQIYAEGYQSDRFEVVVVNDGSTDHTLSEMLRAQALYPSLVIVDFEKNRGLCHGMAACILMARGDILVFVDSDTFVMPGAIRKLVQGFVDPTVGGISGHTDLENAETNVLTKMQDVRYFFSYMVMKAAESIFGMVSCLPGCFSAYRRACVLHVLDDWLNQKHVGRYGDWGDDRSLTNFVLRDYRVLYDSESLATTLAPETWRQYIRQQARWMRSYAREVFTAGTFIWRKHPVPAISWYAMMLLPIAEPVIMLQALVISPIVAGFVTTSYAAGVLLITLVWSLHFLQKTGRSHWWAGFVFTLTYAVFFSWQIYYALATMYHTKWGTRG